MEIELKIWVSKSAVARVRSIFPRARTELDYEFGGFILHGRQSFRVPFTDGDTIYDQIARFLFTYGSAIEVLHPLNLRDAMREGVNDLYDLYKCDEVAFDDSFRRERTSERDPIFDKLIIEDEDPKGTFVELALAKRGDNASRPEIQGTLWAFRKADLFEVCVNGTLEKNFRDEDDFNSEALRYEGLIENLDEFFFLRKYKEFKLEAPSGIVKKLRKEIITLKDFYSQ